MVQQVGLEQPIETKAFSPEQKTPEVKYGLPAQVIYCKRCVISNQRPNSAVEYKHTKNTSKQTIHFDAEGICDACRFAEQKNKIDWNERDRQLVELCNRFRSKDGAYDCIVPGSGGKDSFYAAHILKYRYGMHPLTVTWAPHIYTDWGWHNFQAWLHAGFDNYLMTPNGLVHRLLTRLALENLLHPFQPFMLGQKALAPKLSVLHKIPLVIYGENEAEYGNPLVDANRAERDWRYFTADDPSNIFISGVSLLELKENFAITEQDLLAYLPANPEQLSGVGTEVHYLGYYLRWHPQSCYYYAVEKGGFKPSPERTTGTYSKYNSIDDKIDDFHYYSTGVKFGIGRATYDAAQEIRSGDITREEGVALVRRYDHEFPERFSKEVFEYFSIYPEQYAKIAGRFVEPIMTKEYFSALCDSFRSPHLWKYSNGQYQQRYQVTE